jgi:prepilin peptidase CpaA
MGYVYATFLLFALGLLLVSAGIEDARSREIANWKNAAVALLAPLWWLANGLPVWPDMVLQIGVALLVLGFFAGAFAVGQMGGGDVKLIAALALWLPLQPLISMVVMMTLLGGALTMIMVAEAWVRQRQGMPKVSRPFAAIGIALLVGAWQLSRPGTLAWLQGDPFLWLLTVMGTLAAIGLILLAVVRSARKRGILPETPYGVAIAIAALLTFREPIFNHFG